MLLVWCDINGSLACFAKVELGINTIGEIDNDK